MERKIGEIFKHGELMLKVEEGEGCTGCAFDKHLGFDVFNKNGSKTVSQRNISITGSCMDDMRKDKLSVIFKEVKR